MLIFNSSNVTRPPFQFIALATDVVSILEVSVKRSKAIDPTVVGIFPRWTKGLETDQIAGREYRWLRFAVGISKIWSDPKQIGGWIEASN